MNIETKLALTEMKEQIVDAMKTIIEDSNNKLEKYITDVNEPRFNAIEKDVKRHEKYHEEHHSEIKILDAKITNTRKSIINEINLKGRFHLSTILAIIASLIALSAVIVNIIL